MPSPSSIGLKDFSIGLILALRRKGHTTLDATPLKLHAAYASAYQALEESAAAEQLKLRFVIITDEFHGLSDDVRLMIAYALNVGFLSEEVTEQRFRIMITEAQAQSHFETIPGTHSIYDRAAEALLAHSS